MKQFFKMFFASLLAMIVAGVIVFGVIIGMIVSAVSSATEAKAPTAVTSGSVLYIDLQSQIHEVGEENPFAFLTNEGAYSPGLYDIVRAIEYAETDDKVEGMVLRLNPSPNGWATLQQLRQAVAGFKQSGKFVYAYGEIITQNAYYVATAADSIYLNPVGGIELKGFATVLAFFKGTLDKLEIEPEIFYAGKFKSATEPFRLKQMSEENKQQIAEFQSDFWKEFTTAVAQKMNTDASGVAKIAAEGSIEFPEDAKKYGLVDGLKYADEVEDLIREKTGKTSDEDIKLVQISEYVDNVKRHYSKTGDKIAVLYAEGAIVDGESNDDYQVASKTMAKTIREIRKDDNIKAVVLRVNSPGGSALASEVIYRELELLKKEKSLVVSMGDVAASGGYYISSGADSIFAMPNTITGSIGVFTILMNVEKLMNNRLGITFDEVKNAPYADFPSGLRPLTAEEQQKVQRSVDWVYNTFKSRVAKGRSMTVGEVDEIAQGRVWTGTDAVSNGLVDAIGDLDRAINSAATLSGLEDYAVVTYPEPVDRLQTILKNMKNSPGMAAAIQEGLKAGMSEEYKLIKQVKMLKSMNGQSMMLMPFSIEVK
ncbi:MAG: signal peptide peptidase SppA [Chitinophagales bacterium]|nr:signal peptide peptidase SppA [Chitinophagaceae bacterium]MCB9064939.1 signal peptide peptidase SppA [Chitinophagales bacterium]